MLLLTVGGIATAFFGTARAADDGARAYWKNMEDTNFLSFQMLQFNADSSGSQFDPSLGIYPNSETDMDLFVLMYGRQINLFDRSAMITASIYGGDISSEIGVDPRLQFMAVISVLRLGWTLSTRHLSGLARLHPGLGTPVWGSPSTCMVLRILPIFTI